MNFSFPSTEMRRKHVRDFISRLSAQGVFVIVSMLLLTLAPQAVYGQG